MWFATLFMTKHGNDEAELIHYSMLVAGTWGLRSNSVMTILRHVLVGDTTSFIRTAHARKRYMTNLNL